jgi:hypothetical protein
MDLSDLGSHLCVGCVVCTERTNNKKKYNLKENVQGLLGTFQFDLPKTEIIRCGASFFSNCRINRVFKLIPLQGIWLYLWNENNREILVHIYCFCF